MSSTTDNTSKQSGLAGFPLPRQTDTTFTLRSRFNLAQFAEALAKGETIKASAERCGALHIQTVNSRHSQIKNFLRGFRGIATKYLDSYLRWFHLIELGDQPSPRVCLKAAMAMATPSPSF